MSEIQKAEGVRPYLKTLGDFLEARRAELAKVVPKHLSVDRLVKVALNCVSKTPMLQACSMGSILQCVVTCAELGLEPGGALGHAYLVPHKDKTGNTNCTLIIGYRGFVDLMRRSGQLSTLRAVVVRERDKFAYTEGLEPTLVHEPFIDGDAGPMRYVYAVAKLRDGGVQFEVMSRSQIDAIRSRSSSGNFGPWKTDYEEMARKTVVRRLAKMSPMSSEVARALEAEDEVVDGEVVGQSSAIIANTTAEAALKRRLKIQDTPTEKESEGTAEAEPPASE